MGRIRAQLPRAPNGGYAGPDPKFFYDPLDDKRPLLDIAAPTEADVETFHLAPPQPYPEGKEIRRLDVTCIGTGMAGITLAQLAQWRLKNVNLKIFEKNKKPTGTWYENKYPGCRCDLAAHFYVWRWEPNPTWTAEYVESDEIEKYFARMMEKYNVGSFTTYNAEVLSMTWVEERAAWKLEVKTADGIVEDWTHVIVNGHGILNRPKIPKFEGEENYKGKILHTARFDRSVPLEGKKVAVIGNGSSGIQTIGSIGYKVAELHSYQRSNTWITNQLGTIDKIDVHKFNPDEVKHFSDRKNALDFFKGQWLAFDSAWPMFILGSAESEAATMGAKVNLEKLVRDPALREMLTPTYPVGCRRLTPHEHYFEVLQLPTTTIVKTPIERFTEKGIVSGGVERECDVIIKATGFDVGYVPIIKITGRGGRTLQEEYKEYPWTYKSVMNSGFPNFFHVMGPNAPVASNSIHMLEEQQIAYAVQVMKHLQTTDLVALDPKMDVQKAWHDGIQERLKQTIWHIDCGGWYRHKSGILTSHYPGPSIEYMDELFAPKWDDFNQVKLSDLKDPEQNKISNPKFGADVEKVAEIGPPREPKIPEGADGVADKLAATSI
ncbi:hypothetical protein DFJ74DRAFT_650175 [Hyaloraphidium curvatum]|nr:hypothetical protein DFJ74DRAFT_650175 [Hyaloraphidium curvatum]